MTIEETINSTETDLVEGVGSHYTETQLAQLDDRFSYICQMALLAMKVYAERRSYDDVIESLELAGRIYSSAKRLSLNWMNGERAVRGYFGAMLADVLKTVETIKAEKEGARNDEETDSVEH